MITLPPSIQLANVPTKIEKLERLSHQLGSGATLYVKRDDQTGTELSGNKVRKLEFTVREALDQGCDTLITCGGIQSNHARTTAVIAAKLGLQAHLVLRNPEQREVKEGNYFLNRVLGANIKMITPDEYRYQRQQIMEKLKEELEGLGRKPYIIPEGASSGIGTFGYFKALEEIREQEQKLGITFDAIVTAVGSGGTYAGLFYASKVLQHPATIYGFNVCDDEQYFKREIARILAETVRYTEYEIAYTTDELQIVDGYVGRGYSLSTPEELTFIAQVARLEGVILDPVYTGKALYGLVEELRKGHFDQHRHILFLHTGGLFGLFPKTEILDHLNMLQSPL